MSSGSGCRALLTNSKSDSSYGTYTEREAPELQDFKAFGVTIFKSTASNFSDILVWAIGLNFKQCSV